MNKLTILYREFSDIFARNKPSLFTLLLFFFISSQVFATTYYARASGDWDATNSWSTSSRTGSSAGTIPGVGDNVIIDGRQIDIDAANVTVASVTITNNGNSNTRLRVQNGFKLTVTGNVTCTAENKNKHVDLYLEDNSSEIEIQGSLTFTRSASNTRNARNRLFMTDASILTVAGDFKIDHKNSSGSMSLDDIKMDGTSSFTSSSNVILNMDQGGQMLIDLSDDASWQIDGNTTLTIQNGDDFELLTDDDASLTINGNFNITQTGGEDVQFKCDNSTIGTDQIHILGNFYFDHDAGRKINFELKNRVQFTVDGDFTIDWDGSSSSNKEITFELEDYAELNVKGTLDVNLNDGHNANLLIEIIDNSVMNIGINNGLLAESATFNMQNGKSYNLKIDHDGALNVYGDLDFIYNGTYHMYLDLNQNDNGSSADAQLNVDGDLSITKTNGDVARLYLKNNADITVNGDFTYNSSNHDAGWQNDKIQLLNESAITVLGNFTTDLNDTKQNSLIFDLDNTAQITVGVNDGALAKSATINVTDGYELLIDLDRDSKFTVYGNLNTTFNGDDGFEIDLNYNANGSSADGQLDIKGNWVVTKTDGDRFRLRAKNHSDIKVGGTFAITSTGHDSGPWDDESIILTNDATLDVDKNFSYSFNDANKQNDLIIDLDYDAAFYVGTNDGAYTYSASITCIEGLDFKLNLDRNSKFQVYGDFDIDYSANQELNINLNRSSNGSGSDGQLLIGRDFTINKTDGYAFEIYQNYNSVINVDGDFAYTGTNHKSGWWDDETIRLNDDATFTVDQDFTFTMNDGTHQNDLLLYLYDNAVLNTGTTTSHTATVTQFDGNNMEIYLTSNAVWNNAGDLFWNYTDGSNTSYANLNSSSELNIGKNFTITNAQNSSEFSLYVNSSALLNVDGDIDVSSASNSNRIEIEIGSTSKLELGGDFIRSASPNNYGELWMATNATLEFNGSTSQVFPQEIGAGSDGIYLTKVILNNTSGSSPQFTMEGNNTIHKSITFTDGIVSSTSANMLKLADNGTSSGASNNSYVDGLFGKIGNNTFTFPIGNDGYYAPIIMTNPSSNSDEFDAQYVHSSPHGAGFDTTSTSPRIDHISKTEYWLFNRANGSSNVKATLAWSNTRSGDIGKETLCDLRMARWDGTKWANEGNGGTTGSAASGTLISGTSEDCASSTNITTWNNNYPITFAVDSNFITWDGSVYSGGSGVAGAPNTSDGSRVLKVFGSSATLTADASVQNVIITSSGSITINKGVTALVSGSIVNKGTVTLLNNSSLVQTGTSNNNSGSGNYVVTRDGLPSPDSYNIWSSPIQSADIQTVFPSNNMCDIWVFDHPTQTWSHDFAVGTTASCNGNSVTFTASDVITGGDGIMDIGRGYFIPGHTTSTKEFNGTVNNGTITCTVTTTNLGNPGGTNWSQDDWNLIGNPYPSSMSAALFWAENNSNLTDALYFWDEGDTTVGYNQNSDYASWNLSGGVNSGNSAKIPSGSIASGQGFWLYASNSGSVTFKNSMRTSSNNQFFKQEVINENHNVWISFKTPLLIQNNILVGYNTNATDQIDDNYDAHKLVGNVHVKFASMVGADEFAIQSLAPINIGSQKIIPLSVLSDETGTHTFEEYKRDNLPTNFKVIIRDKVLGIDHDFSDGSYTVDLDANTTYTARFELILINSINIASGGNGTKGNGGSTDTSSTVTSVKESINSKFLVIQNENEITIKNENGLNGMVNIHDITGKLIWNNTIQSGTNSISIDWTSFSSGTYFITINNVNERLFFKQIIKP